MISKELNENLPKQRRLAREEKDKVEKLMSLQVCDDQFIDKHIYMIFLFY